MSVTSVVTFPMRSKQRAVTAEAEKLCRWKKFGQNTLVVEQQESRLCAYGTEMRYYYMAHTSCNNEEDGKRILRKTSTTRSAKQDEV